MPCSLVLNGDNAFYICMSSCCWRVTDDGKTTMPQCKNTFITSFRPYNENTLMMQLLGSGNHSLKMLSVPLMHAKKMMIWWWVQWWASNWCTEHDVHGCMAIALLWERRCGYKRASIAHDGISWNCIILYTLMKPTLVAIQKKKRAEVFILFK